jgi:transcription elongation factor Elf1
MFYVHCPLCCNKVEIPENAVAEDRTDLFNIVVCDVCDLSFDYDDQKVVEEATPSH